MSARAWHRKEVLVAWHQGMRVFVVLGPRLTKQVPATSFDALFAAQGATSSMMTMRTTHTCRRWPSLPCSRCACTFRVWRLRVALEGRD